MYRILLKCGQEVISITRLTSRILRRAGHTIEILDQPESQNSQNGHLNNFGWEDPVATLQQVEASWKARLGEEIVERLDRLRRTQPANVPKAELEQTIDFLTALAQEKSLYFELSEIENSYHRSLGKWNEVLIKNNLAVVKARRNDCLNALNFLAQAIRISLAGQAYSKAPFYNAALIFQQLHKTRLLSDPRYLDVLYQIDSIIHESRQANGAHGNPEQSEAAQANRNLNPVEVYRKIAQTGYNLKVESTLKESEPKLFHRNISYLTPDVDVFESFGNFRDRADSRTAHEFLENGILLTNEEKFGEGIKNFELAKEFDPEFSLESSLRVELASDQWRKGENKRVSTYVKEGEFKDAVDVIRTMDGRLKRDNDWTVVASIRQLDHIATVRRADVLYKLGNAESLAKATDLYVGLLKEEDLTESLSVYVSTQLIGFVADCSNDRERHKKLDELILNNANPEVIDRFSDQLAKQLMREAQSNSAAGNYDLAIEKLFWAIVLPNQTKRREELFQTALYAFNRLLELNQKLSDSDSFKEPLFAELITELHDRWNAEQDKDDAAAFKRLDNEPWILKKQIDELLMLLERLSARTPSTDRLVDKLRLPRERQTQKLFLSIQEQLNLIFQEGDHARRREMIQGELRQLRKLAADFAGGNRPDYAKQISDFIAKAEDYLRNADQQQFLDEMDRESDERNETQFLELREMLRSDSDELILLETICSTARQLQETKFKSQVLTLASHWFERQAKPRYRSLMAKQPERVREVCGRSLDLLRSNENVLPDEAANFRLFLEKSLDDLQPRAEPDQESSTASAESAPPPPSPPRSAPHATVPPAAPSGTRSSQSQFRRFFAWLKSLFRGVS